ncbi:MAG: 3-deoxy-8-phosphooctulonate synthase [Alphaproteobacteria bacterium]|nr:3-deoxy-8-phosphooctulonate synthase [Alphaproteobacteria bacterium]MDD9920095.1 3-deoxy-8-phosphooctulonate synthase [Alphaproteobacteria bacterium]
MQTITVGGQGSTAVNFCNTGSLSILAGTCAIESRDTTLKTAETLKSVCEKLGIGLVYKGSFDKANRTSITGARGTGMDEGLKILEEVRNTFDVPVVTDVHESQQAEAVGQVVDMLQIPAFLARQTDLLIACAKTGKAVNIKKAQFMAPADMAQSAKKVTDSGNNQVLLTERGTTFGYNNLVVDMRGLVQMAETGFPVLMDATHAVMQPSTHGTASGGRREFIAPLARAALAIGVSGLFLETHPNPASAISDKETQIPLNLMPELLAELKALDDFCKGQQRLQLPSAA